MKPSRIVLATALLLLATLSISEARPRKSRSISPATAVLAQPATVKITSFRFDPKTLTVPAGTTVEWINESGRHTIEADNGAFRSAALETGEKFSFKFDKPGTYNYYCTFHGNKGGKDMAGIIKVTAK
jgi:plastocyanin